MPDLRYLSPWASLPWFQIPVETFFTNITQVTQVAQGNPMRVAILFGTPSGAGALAVSTRPDVATNQGLFIQQGIVLQLLQSEVGPLVQQPWFCNPGAGASLTVVEIILRDWPDLPDA